MKLYFRGGLIWIGAFKTNPIIKAMRQGIVPGWPMAALFNFRHILKKKGLPQNLRFATGSYFT